MRHCAGVLPLPPAHLTGAPADAPAAGTAAAGGFELTVDSIMRGPKLVGYPPTGLRWSGDSSRLYFEWRRPGDDEASTWVVGRDGGEPRKLTDEERRSAPPVIGALGQGPPPRAVRRPRRHRAGGHGRRHAPSDHAHDRQRSEPALGAPRNGRSPSRATTTCSSCRSTAAGSIAQLTDVAAEETRSARDRQPEVRQGRRAEADRAHARRSREEEEGRGKGQGARAAEVRARGASVGAATCSSRRTARTSFILIVERAEAAKRPERAELRHRVELHGGHPRPDVRRRRAGQALARRS